jgi:hypothetical protein
LSSSPPFSSSSSSDSSFFPFLAPLAETLDYFLERGFLTSSESSSSEESFLAAPFFAATLAAGFFLSSEDSSSEDSYFFYYLAGAIPLPFTIKSTSDSDDISSSSLESFCFFAFPLVAAATGFLPTLFFGASSSDSSESSEDTGTTCFCLSPFLACF